jgi:hypothetical protein
MLNQEPVVAFSAQPVVLHAHQHPATPQLLTRCRELELALAQGRIHILCFLGHPEAPIPQHYGAAAIFPLGDRAFEVAVVERMVLHLDRQSLVARIKRGSLGHSPGLEDTVVLEPEVIVQAGGGMLLDDKAWVFRRPNLGLAARLRGLLEIALGLVGSEFLLCHWLCG